jgi:hypothetical protein
MAGAFEKLRNNGYSAAEEKAWEDLVHLDSRNIAKNSLAEFDGRAFDLDMLDESVRVDKWEGVITSTQPHDRFFDILVMHYLVGCQARGPGRDLVLFRQLKGGEAYNDAFHKRVNERLALEFGGDPGALVRAGVRLKGSIGSKGSASVNLWLFPKVPVTVIVWHEDEQVPAACTVLFDQSIGDILPTEDVAVAGSFLVEKLITAKIGTSVLSTDRLCTLRR